MGHCGHRAHLYIIGLRDVTACTCGAVPRAHSARLPQPEQCENGNLANRNNPTKQTMGDR
uniref:Uncharacterized protein n=1 Tax=Arion vulgaris TaxID=1028688 RepID=A0A0B7BRR8_9EUPU